MAFVNNGNTLSVQHRVYMNTIKYPVKLMIRLNCIINALPFVHIEDDLDFLNSLFTLVRGFSATADMTKKIMQFKINKFMLNDNDTDSDINFYGEFLENGDKYYLDVEFNNINKDNCKLALLHACSLNKNRDQLILYLGTLQHSFTVIAK